MKKLLFDGLDFLVENASCSHVTSPRGDADNSEISCACCVNVGIVVALRSQRTHIVVIWPDGTRGMPGSALRQ